MLLWRILWCSLVLNNITYHFSQNFPQWNLPFKGLQAFKPKAIKLSLLLISWQHYQVLNNDLMTHQFLSTKHYTNVKKVRRIDILSLELKELKQDHKEVQGSWVKMPCFRVLDPTRTGFSRACSKHFQGSRLCSKWYCNK